MRSISFRTLAALMVALFLPLSSCAHSTSSPTTGVQSPAPPKSSPAVSAPSKPSSAVSGSLTFATPDEWVRVPEEALKEGHSFEMIPKEGRSEIFGRVEDDVGVSVTEYIAQMSVRGAEQGFVSLEPVFAGDGTWGIIVMHNGDKVVIFGIKVATTDPVITVFTFGRGVAEFAPELETSMASVLATLEVTVVK